MKRLSWMRWALLMLGWLGLGGPQLGAAQMRPVSIEDLARRAERVVHARVEAVEMTRDDADRIVTRVELRVESAWKGEAAGALTLVQAGGTVGTRRVVVTGEARYVPGEEVVVFLVANPRGEWLTLELAQGKFSVTRPTPDAAWVANPFHGGDPAPGGYRPATKLPMSLESLRTRVLEGAR